MLADKCHGCRLFVRRREPPASEFEGSSDLLLLSAGPLLFQSLGQVVSSALRSSLRFWSTSSWNGP